MPEQPPGVKFPWSAVDFDEVRQQIPAFAHKIAPVYALLNWRWVIAADTRMLEQYPPSEAKICGLLLRLLRTVEKEQAVACATGGLTVELDEDGDMTIGMVIHEVIQTNNREPEQPALDRPPGDPAA